MTIINKIYRLKKINNNNNNYNRNMILFISDFILSLTTSAPHATKRETFQLTCTIQNAERFDDLICFQRRTRSTRWCLYQDLRSCSRYGDERQHEQYEPKCGKVPRIWMNPTRTYMLTIKMASDEDEGDWWCELLAHRHRSNMTHVHVHGE